MVRYDGDSSPILVAGGGIGGLVTAFALARQGFAVRVFEQAPEFREVGAGIQLGPNIFRVLDKIGLKEAVLGFAHRPPAQEMRDAITGKLITQVPLGPASAPLGLFVPAGRFVGGQRRLERGGVGGQVG